MSAGSAGTTVSNDERESPWYQMWYALTYDRLEEEINLYCETQSSLQNEWDEEIKKYDEELTVTVKDRMENDLTITIPRRNYFTKDGSISDVTLFPYHKALYPLIDAYDSLNDNIYHFCLLSENAFRPPKPPAEHMNEEDYPSLLPCSYEATAWTLGCYPGPDRDSRQHFGPFMFWIRLEFVILDHRHSFPSFYRNIVGEKQYYDKVLSKMIQKSDDKGYTELATKWYTPNPGPFGQSSPYGPLWLPRDRMERTGLLLKVFRHALSERQRDYQLAAGVLVLMIRLRDPDDVIVFRQILASIDSEYFKPSRSGILRDFFQFHRTICFHIIHTGIITFTDELSHCLSAFVRLTILREFPLVLPEKNEEAVIGKPKNVSDLRPTEEYAYVRNSGQTGAVPVFLIESLIRGLGARGHLERVNQFDHLDTCTPDEVESRLPMFRISLITYECIVKTLVNIANTVIQISPEGEHFQSIASELVLSLCRCLRKEEYFVTFRGGVDEYSHFENVGYIDDVDDGAERLRPLRYTEGITNATAKMIEKRTHRRQYKLLPKESLACMRDELFEFFNQKPKQDVLDAVRGLFLRNLVNIRTSALGYGDFLVLCDYEITPLDPMLYWTEYAYPNEEGSDVDDEIRHDGDRPANWVKDEDGVILSYNDLRARNNLQMRLLQRAWQAPWTPETHASFHQPFRAAVETIVKSMQTMGYPHEFGLDTCSSLRRDWWEDTTNECWNVACVREKSRRLVARKMARNYNSSASNSHEESTIQLQPCAHCHVALYCSESCEKRDVYLGHKGKYCWHAVSKPPDEYEIQLYKKIFGGSDGKSTLPIFLQSTSSALSVDDYKQSNILHDVKTLVVDSVKMDVDKGEEADGGNESSDYMDTDTGSNEHVSEQVVDESVTGTSMSITKLSRKYFEDQVKIKI